MKFQKEEGVEVKHINLTYFLLYFENQNKTVHAMALEPSLLMNVPWWSSGSGSDTRFAGCGTKWGWSGRMLELEGSCSSGFLHLPCSSSTPEGKTIRSRWLCALCRLPDLTSSQEEECLVLHTLITACTVQSYSGVGLFLCIELEAF